MTAGEVCNRQVVIAKPDASPLDAAQLMKSHHVGRLPIVNAAGGLEGILTFDDIINLLSEELADLAKLVVREQDRERLPAQPRA